MFYVNQQVKAMVPANLVVPKSCRKSFEIAIEISLVEKLNVAEPEMYDFGVKLACDRIVKPITIFFNSTCAYIFIKF